MTNNNQSYHSRQDKTTPNDASLSDGRRTVMANPEGTIGLGKDKTADTHSRDGLDSNTRQADEHLSAPSYSHPDSPNRPYTPYIPMIRRLGHRTKILPRNYQDWIRRYNDSGVI